MKSKETPQFSWAGLFIVTACCFFIFSPLIKFMNGSPVHSVLFFKIGVVALILSACAYATNLNKALEKKSRKRSASSYNRSINQ